MFLQKNNLSSLTKLQGRVSSSPMRMPARMAHSKVPPSHSRHSCHCTTGYVSSACPPPPPLSFQYFIFHLNLNSNPKPPLWASELSPPPNLPLVNTPNYSVTATASQVGVGGLLLHSGWWGCRGLIKSCGEVCRTQEASLGSAWSSTPSPLPAHEQL